jgi:hypothetical protein
MFFVVLYYSTMAFVKMITHKLRNCKVPKKNPMLSNPKFTPTHRNDSSAQCTFTIYRYDCPFLLPPFALVAKLWAGYWLVEDLVGCLHFVLVDWRIITGVCLLIVLDGTRVRIKEPTTQESLPRGYLGADGHM